MEERRFNISGLYLKQQRKHIFVLQILLPIFILFILFFVFGYTDDFIIKLISFTIVVFIIEITMPISFKYTIRRIKDNEIIVSDSGIIRQNQNLLESLSFNNINKIKVTFYKEKVQYLKIFHMDKSINIFGFEEMDEILTILTGHLKDSETKIMKKKVKINFNNPLILMLYLSVIFILIILLMKFKGNIYENIQLFIPFIIGIYFLIFKPVSKGCGKRFVKFEITIGILMIFLSIVNILMKYLL